MLRSLLLALLLYPASSLADQNKAIWFALQLETFDTDWLYADSVRETRINRATIRWLEKFGGNWTGGLTLAYQEGSQGSNPVPAAQVTTGESLGIELCYDLLHQSRSSAEIVLAFEYNNMQRLLDTQNAEWSWTHGSIGLESKWGFSTNISLLLGVTAHRINGEEVLAGPINRVSDFEANEALEGLIGLKVNLDQTGYVGIDMRAGHTQGGRLTFARSF